MLHRHTLVPPSLGSIRRRKNALPRGTLLARSFKTIQKGNDKQKEDLFTKLGFGGDSGGQRVLRTSQDLYQGLLLEAMKLKDPEHNEKDKHRLAELTEAYQLLKNKQFRENYAAHAFSSNDVQLHVLIDGGEVSANYNPEHQSFCFIDHSKPKGAAPGETASHSLGDFKDAFRAATGAGPSPSEARLHDATQAHAPLHGTDVHFQLRLSFEESVLGCTKVLQYRRHVQCARCEGNGQQKLKKLRKCPQCLGRGSANLPSATYHIERRCTYCLGAGTVMPPRCGACGGAGVVPQPCTVPVTVPPGMISGAVFRAKHKGNDGANGGATGDLVLTALVAEHRHFYRDGQLLHAMLPLPLSTALLGGVVTVPTISGATAALRVPPCVSNGQILPFATYGVSLEKPAEAEAARTDPLRQDENLCFHVLIIVPKADVLSGRQRAALQAYEDGAQQAEAEAKEEEETAETPTTAGSAPPPHHKEGEDLFEQCARLKVQFKHWFTT